MTEKSGDRAQLEDYIYELETRKTADKNESDDSNHLSDTTDIASQLANKEKDLILAAELGKALLERNELLTRANERITEEYSHKLEILEQEKYALRRKLDCANAEFESRTAEMQSDLYSLRKELEEKHVVLRQTEKDKTDLIRELMEQNHRLTSELKQASESENQLSEQLQSVRAQFNVRRTNLNDHVAQLEALREEINILLKRKSDLEKRISILREEREHLSFSLEESSDRIVELEKQNQEQESYIRTLSEDLDECRHTNTQLQRRLDERYNSKKGSTISLTERRVKTALINEIEMCSSSSSAEDEMRSLNCHTLNAGQLDEIECDLFALNEDDCGEKFRKQLLEIYQQLRRVYQDIQRRKDNNGSFNSTQDSGVPATPEEVHTNQINFAFISAFIKEIETQLNYAFAELIEGPCDACKSLLEERTELQRLRKETVEKSDELKKLSEQNIELSTRVTLLETELKAVKEERDNLKECIESDATPKDEIVKRAWELRDQAVARKNTVEIELAKTRIECMHVNSQLMEAIQQKIELSQQLEQWQVDMQSLLDEQLKKKLTSHEQDEKSRTNRLHQNYANVNVTAQLNNKSKFLKLWRT
ncbi:bicaudal D-related protein-like protein [Leptotrombidium deliense]|uniref:Bicaudal D-related protein-like protein n=1 Tax=Leptotrombidium deliense TaxID=299467 RepID=A0A443SRE5_9ACAR|nr:bicaudal D-related protein-like protein [Leptotrombidium deliense]